MICSKCNSETPDGSRFCSVCGAPCGSAADVKPAAAQVSLGKYKCAKCGLELEQGAKFCTVCGGPAANVGNVAPIANSGETFGNGNMAAVSLEKEPDAGDLVAAMNSAASAPTPIPSAVPTAVPAPAPTTNEPTGFAPSGNAGYAPSANTGYAPGAVMGGYNGLSGAAAVVTAPPATKKKMNGGKIALIIAIVLILLVGGAAVFFFTNKAAALSLVMGKPKYAAMVEKQSLKEAAEKLDTAALSGQIKTFSSIMSAMGDEDYLDALPFGMSYNNHDAKFAKLMSYGGSDGVDIKGILKGYNEFMQTTYGASRIYGSVTANITLGDKLRSELDDDLDTVKEVLDIINGAEITYDAGLSEKQAGMELGIKLGSKPLNVKAIITDDGSVYAMFPFASDKALKYTVETGESSASSQTQAMLELDKDEISRLLGELIEIYTDYIKDSSVTMENGGLVAAGIPVEGKQITADIGGEKLEGLIKALLEHIANDKYFCDKIVEYAKSFDPSFTAEDYKNEILDAIPEKGDIDDTERLIVTTIVNNSGKILAKSYKAVSGSENPFEILMAEDGKTGAVEFKEDGKSTLTMLVESTSDTDGKVTLNVGTDDDEYIGITVTYSGVGTATFGKTEIPVGTYTLAFDVSRARSSLDEEERDILNGMSVKMSTSVDNGTEKSSVDIVIKDYITASIKADASLSDDMSKFDPPANAIDFSDPYSADEAQLMEFVNELMTGLKEAIAGTPLEDYMADALDGYGAMSYGGGNIYSDDGPNTNYGNLGGNYDAVDALEEQVWTALDEVYDWYEEFNVYSGEAFDNALAYQDKLRDLDDKIWDAYYDITDEQLKQFRTEYQTIITERDAIHAGLQASKKPVNTTNLITNTNANTGTAGVCTGVPLASGTGLQYGQQNGYGHHGQSCYNANHGNCHHSECPCY